MFRWLRSGNPYHVIILLVYAICIKYYYLIHPVPVLTDPQADGIVYQYLFGKLHALSLGGSSLAILAFIVIFTEAILLNSVVNRFHLLPGPSYFPAFCFLLFSSFFPQWNVLSAPLLANLILLILLPKIFDLYSTSQPRSRAFSVGFFTGLAALFYTPVLIFLVLMWIALLISRPFRLAEWILVLMGMLCPYYFLGTALFLLDKLDFNHIIGFPLWSYPDLLSVPWVMGGALFILIWFLYGNIRMQQDHMKMMIHERKCWEILLAFVAIAFLLPFFPNTFSLAGWWVTFLPMAVFIALAFWYVNKGWLAMLIHGCSLAYIFLIQWVY